MKIAEDVASRGNCEKAQIGAVIVDPTQRIVATGYNGPARNFQGECKTGCDRFAFGDTSPNYQTCISIHAEANALMFSDRRHRNDGTIYVNGAVCMDCAKLISNSGLHRVVMHVVDDVRNPRYVTKYLMHCGLEVNWWVRDLTTSS